MGTGAQRTASTLEVRRTRDRVGLALRDIGAERDRYRVAFRSLFVSRWRLGVNCARRSAPQTRWGAELAQLNQPWLSGTFVESRRKTFHPFRSR